MSSRAKKKAETLHVKKFMGGRATPDEVHRALAIRKACGLCGSPKAAIRIRILVPLKEVQAKAPEFLAEIMANNPQGPTAPLPVTETVYGPMLKISDQAACDNCKSNAEKLAAHPPRHWPFRDSMIVDIDRGPGKDKPFTQVTANLDGTLH
jgi:hypothetical protein